MTNLRVLHLSDLHLAGTYKICYKSFGKIISVYNSNVLNALSETIYRLRNHLDAILISGDIAVAGTKSDLKRAIEFFKSPPHPLAGKEWLNSENEPTLQTFSKPVIIVPGNHDRYCNASGWPGNQFYNYFSSYWKAGAGGVQYDILPDETSPILAIICGDFSLDKISDSSGLTGHHWGQGRVYKNRLQNLVRTTKRVKKLYPSCAVIWMVHFAPEFEGLEKNLTLIDSEKLIKQAVGSEVRYIFCGHTHLSREYQPEESYVWVNCAGTSTCIEPDKGATIHLRNIKVDKGEVIEIASRNFIYDPESQHFLPKG